MTSTHMISSLSRRTTILRRSAAVLALGAILGSHLVAPGSALAGGCGDADADGDGLTCSQEFNIYGTDDYSYDTDGDSVNDGLEVYYGSNPLVADYAPEPDRGIQNNPGYDYDGDGLGAYDEQTYGTSAEYADTDVDGLNDGDEVFYYGTSPVYADSDGDSYGDGYELAMGFDPLNRFSVPPAPNGKG
jgi:hypothetical protein